MIPHRLPAAAVRIAAAVPFAAAVLMAAPAAASDPEALDPDLVTRRVDRIRHALPDGWSVTDMQWSVVPLGWEGPPSGLLVRTEDLSIRFPDPDGGPDVHPFFDFWILPPAWEGRMEVAEIDPHAASALYLGENDEFRVFHRTVGRNSWPEGADAVAAALGLDAYPLGPRPMHQIDVTAMQALYRRLDTSPRAIERWQRQIYGIAEMPGLIYLELLTWDDRKGAVEPTFLGELAERETEYLSSQALAAFPQKRALYLRRITQGTFSDVLVVNRARLAPPP